MDKETATHLPATGDLSSHTPMMQQYWRVTFKATKTVDLRPYAHAAVPLWPPCLKRLMHAP